MSTYRSEGSPSSSGISRRKTGCWTCRIRRKRCDEIPDNEGRCQECVRLRIPCAGWGEKRPEWSKDEETLRNFKESIKKQLMTRAPRAGAPLSAAGLSFPGVRDHQLGGDGPLDDEGINESVMYRMQTNHMSHYPEYTHSFPSRGPQPSEMFDYPGFAARLFAIAQASQLPPEYISFVIQIAELEQWKAMQDANGTLSYRELARRGKAIERVLLGQAASGSTSYSPAAQSASLYSSASTSSPYAGHGIIPLPSQSAFANVVAQSSPSQLIFVDACLFMLHSVVSGPNPRVPELANATRSITMRFSSIPIHQRTISLIFPLCVAGALAETTESQYIQAQVNSLGAPPDLVQAVNGLILNVNQSRWTHEMNNTNPLMA